MVRPNVGPEAKPPAHAGLSANGREHGTTTFGGAKATPDVPGEVAGVMATSRACEHREMNGERSAEWTAPASSVARRVLVTGIAGAGKSTFSRALSERTGLPVIHLDVHFWKPGWVPTPDDEWRATQRRLLAGAEWIADGNYPDTLDVRLERADTVVFIDTPWSICARRAFVRGIRRPVGFELPAGCHESAWRRLRDEWGLAWRISRDRHSERERELLTLSQRESHATLHVLRSRQAVCRFLDSL